METRDFDYDDFSRTRSLFHYDHAEGKFYIEEVADVEPAIEDNKVRFNYFDERAPWKGEWHHVASIPPIIVADLQKKGIGDDMARLKMWLNDSDNRVFRTRPGKI